MITTKELELISKDYFRVIQTSGYAVYLQSKNTKHFWGIMVAEYSDFRNSQIYHKHHQNYSYHRHKDAPTIIAMIEGIKGRDKYQLNGRR